MWPGLKKQKSRRQSGVGSQTAISQTSLEASGCERLSAGELGSMRVLRKRRGEEDRGEESTRTRCAEGVLGGTSIEDSKRRYRRLRWNV
jgi:hypothetical protein